MQLAANPPDEAERLRKVEALKLLYRPTLRSEDEIVRMAKLRFNVEFAVFSLITAEEQWYKAADGPLASSCARNLTFCTHALQCDDILVVRDPTSDPRFADNPAVTGPPYLRFYAGYPLRIDGGSAIGTFCIFSAHPHPFTAADQKAFMRMGRTAESLLIQQNQNLELAGARLDLKSSHDFRTQLDEPTGNWAPSALAPLLQAKTEALNKPGVRPFLAMVGISEESLAQLQSEQEPLAVIKEAARALRSATPEDTLHFHHGCGKFVLLCGLGSDESPKIQIARIESELANPQRWEPLGILPPRCEIETIIGPTSSKRLVDQSTRFLN